MIAKTNQHDIIDLMNIIKGLKNGQEMIKEKLDFVLEKISLHVVFLLGIGLTSLFATLFFKNFVPKKYFYTSWKKHKKSNTYHKMY